MAMSGKTTRKNIPYPKTTDPDTLAANHQVTSEAVDTLNEGHQDFLQAGVVASTGWSLTANINSGTGALGSTGNTGGTAWLPDPVVSGALMRSVTTAATLSGITPSLLPASGKYVSCAFELTPSTWGAAATVTAHSGTEKNTEAEAIAAPPATTAGKCQVRRVIIHNAAGVYSIVAQEDVRPSCEAIYKPGDLKPSAVSTPQFGWLLCDGSAKSRVTYAVLFAAIGTTFGAGDGSKTFNLPAGMGRTMIGSGEASGAEGATSHALGSKGGEQTHNLTEAEMPSHTHGIQGTNGFGSGASPVVIDENKAAVSLFSATESAGEGADHNNMQPYFTGNWFIKF